MQSLNCLEPTGEPRATDHIQVSSMLSLTFTAAFRSDIWRRVVSKSYLQPFHPSQSGMQDLALSAVSCMHNYSNYSEQNVLTSLTSPCCLRI